MNLILFETAAEATRIAGADPRAQHIRKVLRARVGDAIHLGVVNGPRGLGKILADNADGIHLAVEWEWELPSAHPIQLLVGLPRPHTAKRVLFDAACLGVAELTFFQADKGEPSYAQSSLWSTQEWRERLWLGAEQGLTTRLPEVRHFDTLPEALKAVPSPNRLALDIYEGVGPLSTLCPQRPDHTTLAIGVERGWSANERHRLRVSGFALVGLGAHVLRTETACLAGVSVLLASWGRM